MHSSCCVQALSPIQLRSVTEGWCSHHLKKRVCYHSVLVEQQGAGFGPDDPRFLEKALLEVVKGRVSFLRQQSSSLTEPSEGTSCPAGFTPPTANTRGEQTEDLVSLREHDEYLVLIAALSQIKRLRSAATVPTPGRSPPAPLSWAGSHRHVVEA